MAKIRTPEENIEIARFCYPTESRPLNSTERDMFILANEYMDFCEFLEDELDDFDEVRARFFAQEAQRNIEGHKRVGINIIADED